MAVRSMTTQDHRRDEAPLLARLQAPLRAVAVVACVLALGGCGATGNAPTPCVASTTVVLEPAIDQPGQYRFEAAFGGGATMACDAALVSTTSGVRVDLVTCTGALELRPSHYVDPAACATGDDAGAHEGCRGIDLGRLSSTQGIFDTAHVRVLLGDTVVRELTADVATDVALGSPACVGRELRPPAP